MLRTIKQAVANLPEKNFSEFYQDYVMSQQDSIINHDVRLAEHQFSSIEDVNLIIKGLNNITEELRK